MHILNKTGVFPAVSQSAPEDLPQYIVTENEAYGTLTQHPQEQQVGNGGGG